MRRRDDDVHGVEIAAPPSATGFGDESLPRRRRQIVDGHAHRRQAAAVREVVAGENGAAGGGVDQGCHHSTMKGAGVGREVVAERDLEPHAVGIPPGDRHADERVEGDLVLIDAAKAGAQLRIPVGLFDLGRTARATVRHRRAGSAASTRERHHRAISPTTSTTIDRPGKSGGRRSTKLRTPSLKSGWLSESSATRSKA